MNLNTKPKEYKIPKSVFVISIAAIVFGLICIYVKGITLTQVYNRINSVINSDSAIFSAVLILAIICVIHSILLTLRTNIDKYGKQEILSLDIWAISFLTGYGSGFMGYNALKVLSGILGESTAGIKIFVPGSSITLWPFAVLSVLIIIYCAIKIGSIISETVTLCKSFIK